MQRSFVAMIALFVGVSTCLLEAPRLFADETTARGLSQPITAQAPANNAGLFLGVNQFNDDPDIPPLQFAVNDAVEQAHMFVVQLKLIPAKNCFLAVSGEPSNQDVKDHLESLQRLGVNVIEAEKSTVLRALLKLRAISTDVSDMVVVSLSSHGFEEFGKAFVMPADGLKDFLADTAINLDTLEAQLKKSKAGQQILLVDACQEKVSVSAEKGIAIRPTSRMGSGFSDALKVTSGQARLASCSEGEFSYEHRDLRNCGHGVFTAKLLEALEGNAGADAENVIRMQSVASYVRTGVNEWVEDQNRLSGAELKQQSPAWFGSDSAGKFGLAKRMGGSEALIAFLNAQEHPRAFDDRLKAQLIQRLKQSDGSKPEDAELLNQVAGYIEGRISVALFVPYLRHTLADSSVSVTPLGLSTNERNPPENNRGLIVEADFSLHVSRLMKHHQLSGFVGQMFANMSVEPSSIDLASTVIFSSHGSSHMMVRSLRTLKRVNAEQVVERTLGSVPNPEMIQLAGNRTFQLWNVPGRGAVLHHANDRLFARFQDVADCRFLIDRDPANFDKLLIASAGSFHGDLATGFIDLKKIRSKQLPENFPPPIRKLIASADEIDLSLSDENGLEIIGTVLNASPARGMRTLSALAQGKQTLIEFLSQTANAAPTGDEAGRLAQSVIRALKNASMKPRGSDISLRMNVPIEAVPDVPAPHTPTDNRNFFLPPKNSKDKGGRVELLVTNEMSQTINLTWVDHSGRRISYGQVRPGDTRSVQTNVGHVWLVQSLTRRDLAAFESHNGVNNVRISRQTIGDFQPTNPGGGAVSVTPNMPNPSSTSPVAGKWKCSCGGTWNLTQNGSRMSGTESGPDGLGSVSGTWSGNEFLFTYVKANGLQGTGVITANGDRATGRIDWTEGRPSLPTLTRIKGGGLPNRSLNMPNPLSTSPFVGRWQCSCGDIWTLQQNGNRLTGSETGKGVSSSVSGSWSGNEFIFSYMKPNGMRASGIMHVNGDRATARLNWQNGGSSHPTLTRIR